MLLKELFRKARIRGPLTPLVGGEPDNIEIKSLTDDSRAVQRDTLFVASEQGLPYLDSLLQEKRAAAILLDSKDLSRAAVESWLTRYKKSSVKTALFACKNLLEVQGFLASTLYGEPSHSLQMIGITGTNGKTTTAWILYHLWIRLAKMREEREGGAGMIGTLGAHWEGPKGKVIQETGYTTPRAPNLHALLKTMLNDGVKKVVVEVSSEGLDLGRLYGIKWNQAVFTNLSPEHLDHHNDMEAYYQAKKRLFDQCAADNGDLIICCCDKSGQQLKRDFGNYSRLISLTKPFVEPRQLPTCFHGEFNRINASLALLAAGYRKGAESKDLNDSRDGCQYDKNYEQALTALRQLPPPPGRFEIIYPDGRLYPQISERIFGIVDYAHTPEALSHLLRSVREKAAYMVCVFGCGGERDQTKRPLMGAVAAKLADYVVITDDNPRSEDPAQIRQEISNGMDGYKKNAIEIAERQKAIEKGVELTLKAGLSQELWPAVVIVAGKGHESRQILKERSIPFSDQRAIRKAFQKHFKRNVT